MLNDIRILDCLVLTSVDDFYAITRDNNSRKNVIYIFKRIDFHSIFAKYCVTSILR